MSLASKLYKIGSLVSDDDIKKIIEIDVDRLEKEYATLIIDFQIKNDKISSTTAKLSSLDNLKTMFTKKIGGTSNSYYLYPNFEYQKERDLYKKFKSSAHTLSNSILVYANEKNKLLAKFVLDFIKSYNEDILELKKYETGNYFLVLTINGKSFYELMPEVWDNYIDEFVKPHLTNNDKPVLETQIDIMSQKEDKCGYNPDIKFFTMDNYHDSLKSQMINKLPMSLHTAKTIKKGWMYAINHLKFYHKGLEYIIIPTMIKHDEEIFSKMLNFLAKSTTIEQLSSKEGSFIRRLSSQIENFDEKNINYFTLDILFTEVNTTNLSVRIFSTLEDVLPSRIKESVIYMQNQNITDDISNIDKEYEKYIYLKYYFRTKELFAIAKKNTKAMKNIIIQEKIYLAKILLGYSKIDYIELLKRFEHAREYTTDNKKRLQDGIKEWINYPESVVRNENKILNFLNSINSINYRSQK